MVLDHVCIVFYPDQSYWMRSIGQIGYPLLCYLLIQGHKYTSSHKKYLIAIFITAVVAQPFFTLLFPTYYRLNDLFTFFFALVIILIYEKLNSYIFFLVLPNKRHIVLKNYPFIKYLVFLIILPLTYFQIVTIYIVLIFIFYFNQNDKISLFICSFLFYSFISFLSDSYLVYSSMLFMIFLIKPLPRFKINKYAFYFFYPFHFSILCLLSFAIT